MDLRTRTFEGTSSGKPSIGRLAGDFGKIGHSVEGHVRCRNCDTYRAHRAVPLQEENTAEATAVFRKSVAKRQYASAFSLVSHALSACSAQKLAASVLEEELDATSLVLGGASFTQSPVGLETPAAVFGVVGASSTELAVGRMEPVAVCPTSGARLQSNLDDPDGCNSDVRHAQCQTP